MERERGLDRSAAMADMRFSYIDKVCKKTVRKPIHSKEKIRSEKIDRFLTGKYSAIPAFIGIMALIIVYALFIWRGMKIAIKAPDHFGMLLASGIIMMVAIQVILNIAVVTASMPATGINLPFISYGGNGILMFMLSAGIILNIPAVLA